MIEEELKKLAKDFNIIIDYDEKHQKAFKYSYLMRSRIMTNQKAKQIVEPNILVVRQNQLQESMYVNPENDKFSFESLNIVPPVQMLQQRNNVSSRETYVDKKNQYCFCIYQQIYFELRHRKLCIYSKGELIGCFNFDLEEFQSFSSTEYFGIRAVGCSQSYTFRGNQEQVFLYSVDVDFHLENSIGITKNLRLQTKTPTLFKQNSFSHQQVLEDCQAGDLVFFKSKDQFQQAKRTKLNQEYDHMGIFYTDKNGQVWVLEATPHGVGTFIWDDMIFKKWYELYDKVVIRVLQFEKLTRNGYKVKYDVPNLNKKLLECILENIGDDYNILEPNQIKDDNNQIKNVQFCSYLIAKIYQKCEILDNSREVYTYLLSDFQQGSKIDSAFKLGGCLGYEGIVFPIY